MSKTIPTSSPITKGRVLIYQARSSGCVAFEISGSRSAGRRKIFHAPLFHASAKGGRAVKIPANGIIRIVSGLRTNRNVQIMAFVVISKYDLKHAARTRRLARTALGTRRINIAGAFRNRYTRKSVRLFQT